MEPFGGVSIDFQSNRFSLADTLRTLCTHPSNLRNCLAAPGNRTAAFLLAVICDHSHRFIKKKICRRH